MKSNLVHSIFGFILFSMIFSSCSLNETSEKENKTKSSAENKEEGNENSINWELKSLSPNLSASMNLPEEYEVEANLENIACDDYQLVDLDITINGAVIHINELEECIDDRLLIEYENIVADTLEYKIVRKTDRLIVKEKGDMWRIYCFRNPAGWPYVFFAEGTGESVKENIVQSFLFAYFQNEPEEKEFHKN